jgi:carbonic anhydrase
VKAQTWRVGYDLRHDCLSDDLVQRNAAFAATGAFAGLPFPASDTLQVLGCVDSRVDPSDVLGLKLGESVVMRNIGGRITPAALRSWAPLGRLGQGQPPSGHLVILHHTDCGIRRLAAFPEQLAAFFEIPADELESKASTTHTRQSGSMPPSPGMPCRRAGSCPAWSTTSAPVSSRLSTGPPRSSGLVQGTGHRRRRPCRDAAPDRGLRG